MSNRTVSGTYINDNKEWSMTCRLPTNVAICWLKESVWRELLPADVDLSNYKTKLLNKGYWIVSDITDYAIELAISLHDNSFYLYKRQWC